MASITKRTSSAWYLRHGKEDHCLPLSDLGPWSEAKESCVRAIVAAVTAEALASKPRGRPAKVAAPAADFDAAVAAAVKASVAALVVPAAAPAVPVPVAAAPVGCPTPAEAVEWYLQSLTVKHAKQTQKSAKAVLSRACREMGGTDWAPWISTSTDTGTWAWLAGLKTLEAIPQQMNEKTRGRYQSFLHAFRAKCLATNATTPDGRPYSGVPDFMPAKYRPSGETPTEMLKNGTTSTTTNVVPFTVEEVRSILRTADTVGFPDYFRLGVHVLAKMGLDPKDARRLLQGEGTFDWDGEEVWYRCARSKTASPINVPLAPSLAALLRPYRNGTTLRLPTKVANEATWDYHFERIYGLAKIERIDGKSLGRLRHTLTATMENTLGVPESVREALMAHSVRKANRINTHYTHPESRLMVKAVRDFDALIAPNGAGKVATA